MEGPLKPDKNPLFSDPKTIPVSYWERLKEDFYSILFLGFKTEIDKTKRLITIKDFPLNPNFQIYLAILSYLHIKDERKIILTDRWVLPKELKGGIHFFDRSHPIDVSNILKSHKNNLKNIKDACLRYKGKILNIGDFAYEFEVFPEILIRYIFYEGDEDFSPAITVNFQKGLEDYFPLDVVWAITNILGACLENSPHLSNL